MEGIIMPRITAIPTLRQAVSDDVLAVFNQLREIIEAGECQGLAIALVKPDGRSLTRVSKAIGRRDMLAILLDLLIDYQQAASSTSA